MAETTQHNGREKLTTTTPTRIFILHGFDMLGEHGEHLAGGRCHTVTLGFARELIGGGRARRPTENEEARTAEIESQAAPEVQHRDPKGKK